jgi:hypothetical protein
LDGSQSDLGMKKEGLKNPKFSQNNEEYDHRNAEK